MSYPDLSTVVTGLGEVWSWLAGAYGHMEDPAYQPIVCFNRNALTCMVGYDLAGNAGERPAWDRWCPFPPCYPPSWWGFSPRSLYEVMGDLVYLSVAPDVVFDAWWSDTDGWEAGWDTGIPRDEYGARLADYTKPAAELREAAQFLHDFVPGESPLPGGSDRWIAACKALADGVYSLRAALGAVGGQVLCDACWAEIYRRWQQDTGAPSYRPVAEVYAAMGALQVPILALADYLCELSNERSGEQAFPEEGQLFLLGADLYELSQEMLLAWWDPAGLYHALHDELVRRW